LNLALVGFLLVNIVFIVLFVLGKEVVFKFKNNPKLTAGYSVVLGVLFLLYFLAIFGISLMAVLTHKYLPVSLLLSIFATFVIGQKVTYAKLSFYSNLQLLVFLGSLILGLIFLKIY